MRYYFFLFALIAYSNIFGQAQLSLFVTPDTALVRIDGEIINTDGRKQPIEVTVSAGTHTVEIWDSPYLTETKEVTVSNGETQKVVIGVRRLDPDYEVYIDQKGAYDRKKILRYGYDAFLGAASISLWTAAISVKGNQANRYKDAALDLIPHYNSTTIQSERDAFIDSYNNYNELYQKEQKKDNIKRVAFYSLAAGTTLFTLFTIRRHIKNPNKPPSYSAKDAFSAQWKFEAAPSGAGIGLVFSF